MGVGGVALRLLTGGEVQSVGAGSATLGVEDPTKPTEVLKQAVAGDITDLSERVTALEKQHEEEE
jgi:hypothetical protein